MSPHTCALGQRFVDAFRSWRLVNVGSARPREPVARTHNGGVPTTIFTTLRHRARTIVRRRIHAMCGVPRRDCGVVLKEELPRLCARAPEMPVECRLSLRRPCAILRQAAGERGGEGEPELDRWAASSHPRALCVHGVIVQDNRGAARRSGELVKLHGLRPRLMMRSVAHNMSIPVATILVVGLRGS